MYDVIDPLLKHPYGFYKSIRAKSIIIGSFPIAKFTNPALRSTIKLHEIDFFYGGEKNKLWKVLSAVFARPLTNKSQIITFLEDEGLALADIIESCRSRNNSAADKDLYDISWNNELANWLQENKIKRLYFTSKWVQQNFNKHISPHYKESSVVLLSPSPAANVAVASTEGFKAQKALNPLLKVDEYRVQKYREIFLSSVLLE